MANLKHTRRSDEETPLLLTAGEGSPTPLPKLQIAILLFLQLMEPMTAQCIYPFINQLVSELDIIDGDTSKVGYYAGMLESLFFVTEAIFTLQWSRLSDRIGRKPVLLIGLSGLTISMLSFGLSTKYWTLVLSRCVAGLLNGNIGVIKSMMGEHSNASNMAQAFSLMPMIWSAGATLGPFIGGSLSRPHERFPTQFGSLFWKEHPYFLPCAVTAGIAFTAFLVTLFFLQETVQKGSKQETRFDGEPDSSSNTGARKSTHNVTKPCQSSPDSSKHKDDSATPLPLFALSTRPVVVSVANYALLALLNIALEALQPLFYSTPINLGGLSLQPHTIGWILGAFGLFDGLFQGFFFSGIVRWLGPRRVFIIGMSMFVPIFLGFAGIHAFVKETAQGDQLSAGVWVAVAAQLALCTVMLMAYGSSSMYITAAAPNKRSLGATNGLAQTSASIARAIGPALSTSLFAFSIRHKMLNGYASYVVLAIGSMAALSVARMLPNEMWEEGMLA